MNFLDHMIDACSTAQVGFHFEEGGCIGMAIALHEALVADGLSPTLVKLTNVNHVAVAVNGSICDHQGTCFSKQECRTLSLEELRALADEWNSDIEGDAAWAREVIALAREFAAAPGLAL